MFPNFNSVEVSPGPSGSFFTFRDLDFFGISKISKFVFFCRSVDRFWAYSHSKIRIPGSKSHRYISLLFDFAILRKFGFSTHRVLRTPLSAACGEAPSWCGQIAKRICNEGAGCRHGVRPRHLKSEIPTDKLT